MEVPLDDAVSGGIDIFEFAGEEDALPLGEALGLDDEGAGFSFGFGFIVGFEFVVFDG